MATDSWYKQNLDKPLFEATLWSRPESRQTRGKLLIVGGHTHALNAPGVAFNIAVAAGAGSVRVILPASTKRLIGKSLPEADFAPSTPSGSFSRQSLAQLLDHAQWANGVLLAGDFGRNSETAILLESFVQKYSGKVIVAQDGADYFLGPGSPLLSRSETLSILTIAQLQKLGKQNGFKKPVKHSMNLQSLVELLAETSRETDFITYRENSYVVASGGQISTTAAPEKPNWQVELAAYAAVWSIQQPQKPFEAVTSAAFLYINN